MSKQSSGQPFGIDTTDPMPLLHTKDPNRVRQSLLRYLDVALVVLAMAPAMALGAPVLGYAVGAGGWILQRAIAETDRRWIRRVAEPRKQLGVSLFEAFGRIWLLAGVIIVAGVPLGSPGTTNMVRIAHLDDKGNPVSEGT